MLFVIYITFKTLDFATIFAMAHEKTSSIVQLGIWEINAITLISIFLFVGAVGKSAQLGLHT